MIARHIEQHVDFMLSDWWSRFQSLKFYVMCQCHYNSSCMPASEKLAPTQQLIIPAFIANFELHMDPKA